MKEHSQNLHNERRKIRRAEANIEGKICVSTTADGQPYGKHKEVFVQRFRTLVMSRMDISLHRVDLCPKEQWDAVTSGLQVSRREMTNIHISCLILHISEIAY